jgi:hypothetical protein
VEFLVVTNPGLNGWKDILEFFLNLSLALKLSDTALTHEGVPVEERLI